MAGPMTPEDHDAVASLLGAYALDAVDADERALVEDHLGSCARCRAEVSDHQEVAAALAGGGAELPDGLWDRIAGSIDGPPAPAPVPMERARPAAEARRRERTRTGDRRARRRLVGVAAAAVVVVALGVGAATTIAQQDQKIDRLADEVALAQERSELRVAQLAGGDGATVSAVVAGDQGFVLADGLAPLDADSTYQLWGITDGEARSLGLLGAEPGVEAFEVDAGVTTLAITEEPALGATQPSGAPLLAGELA